MSWLPKDLGQFLDFSSPITSSPLRALLPPTLILLDILLHLPYPTRIKAPFVAVSDVFTDYASIKYLSAPLIPRKTKRSLGRLQWGCVGLAAVEGVWWMGKIVMLSVDGTDERELMMGIGMIVTWIFLIFIPIIEPTPIVPTFPFLLYLLLFGFSLTNLCSAWLDWVALDHQWSDWATTAFLMEEAGHAIVQFGLICCVLGMPTIDPEAAERLGDEVTFEETTTLWGWLCWSPIFPIMRIGRARTIMDEEVPPVSVTMKTEVMFDLFQRTPGRTIWIRLLKIWARDLAVDWTWASEQFITQLLEIYGVRNLLEQLSLGTSQGRAGAYKWAIFVIVMEVLGTGGVTRYRFCGARSSLRIHSILLALLYRKALTRRDVTGRRRKAGRLEEESLRGKNAGTNETADLGKINSLISGDVDRIVQLVNSSWIIPYIIITLTGGCWWIFQSIGYSCLVAISLYIVSGPLTTYVSKMGMDARKGLSQATDERLSLMNEMISSVKNIKLFGWQTQWRHQIEAKREVELKRLFKRVAIELLLYFTTTILTPLSLVLTLLSYVYLDGGELTVSLAFGTLMLFDKIKDAIKRVSPQITRTGAAWVAAKRIDAFLAEKDVDAWAGTLREDSSPEDKSSGGLIAFADASFRWNVRGQNEDVDNDISSSEHERLLGTDTEFRFSLDQLSLSFPKGKLRLITGPTSCGKSALLLALLGEMTCTQGRVLFDKHGRQQDHGQHGTSVAYCGQSSWLRHMSIRDNIVFGGQYDEKRLEEVIYECALGHDLEMLEDGIATEVGVGGKTLSGGQQARIALARAIYSKCPVVLLDDPLSAVDSHTVVKLVQRCLLGPLLKGRTCLMVTHHVELVAPAADYIVSLSAGNVVEAYHPMKTQDPISSRSSSTLEEIKEEIKDKEQAVVVARKVVEKEYRQDGQVSWESWKFFFTSNGRAVWAVSTILLVLGELATYAGKLWLATWATSYVVPSSWHGYDLPSAEDYPGWYLAIYAGLQTFNLVVGPHSLCLRSNLPTATQQTSDYHREQGGLKASRKIHHDMLKSIIGSTIRWFDLTPGGRITNRFSSDLFKIDDDIPRSFRDVQVSIASSLGSIITIAFYLPSILLAMLLYLLPLRYICLSYLSAVRDLRRIKALRGSSIFQAFEETSLGTPVLRAYGVELPAFKALCKDVDASNAAAVWMQHCNRFQIVHMDFWNDIFHALVIGVSIGYLPPGLAGVVISTSTAFAQHLFQFQRNAMAFLQNLDSIERAREYVQLPQEPPAVIEGKRPPAAWPSMHEAGKPMVEFRDVWVRYAPELPDILKGVTLSFEKGEKIGLIGRTGSGKSTLAMSLLRFTDPSRGSIIYDNLPIASIGVEDLRRSITYIPQSPCLFAGSLRRNIDVFGEYSDAEVRGVIEAVQLNQLAAVGEGEDGQGRAFGLDTEIAVGGKSVSAGQAQLIALARAMLLRKPLVIADEPTSNIDLPTDQLIQQAMRSHFKDSTVIAVAHRISSVIDYDRVCVLEDGEVVEFDKPVELLKREGGKFKEMCQHSGHFLELFEAAKSAEEARKRRV